MDTEHVPCLSATVRHQPHAAHDWTIDGSQFTHCPGYEYPPDAAPPSRILKNLPCLRAVLLQEPHDAHVWYRAGDPYGACPGFTKPPPRDQRGGE